MTPGGSWDVRRRIQLAFAAICGAFTAFVGAVGVAALDGFWPTLFGGVAVVVAVGALNVLMAHLVRAWLGRPSERAR